MYVISKKETLADLLETHNREVLNIYVIGHEGCGKVIHFGSYNIHSF